MALLTYISKDRDTKITVDSKTLSYNLDILMKSLAVTNIDEIQGEINILVYAQDSLTSLDNISIKD